uniref:hypothetical protein n=1 Tax=Wolbachia endosymbiont of Pentidionis agamae TaxID=3110435 RepID=UPI002FD3D47E
MTVGLTFGTTSTQNNAKTLQDVRFITFENSAGNIFELDIQDITSPVFRYAAATASLSSSTTVKGWANIAKDTNIMPLITNIATGIFAAEDTGKNVLVDKLGALLGATDKAKYDNTNNQSAAEFLAAQGKLITEDNVATKVTGFAKTTDLANKADLTLSNITGVD